jgi:hypothetical protein
MIAESYDLETALDVAAVCGWHSKCVDSANKSVAHTIRMKAKTKTVFIATVAAAWATVGSALPILTISDGINTLPVVDDGFLDWNNTIPGLVTFNGSIGVWTINVDTGLTKPESGGTPTAPAMDLNFITRSRAAGTLTLRFYDDGWTYLGILHNALSVTAGTLQGNTITERLIENAVIDPNTGIMTGGTTLSSLGPWGPGPASGSQDGMTTTSPDTLTLEIVIHQSGADFSSGDASLTDDAVPEGGLTVALLGLALSAVEGLRRKICK